MRLFLSIEPNDVARRALLRVQRRLAEVGLAPVFRPTRPEQLHLTIKFIGEWEDARLPPLIDVLRELRFDPLQAHLACVEAIPSAHQPRVLAAGVEPRDALSALAGRVDEALHAIGVPREARAFRPHITIARLRAGRRATCEQAQDLIAAVGPLRASFRVASLVLMESRLTNHGATHTELWRGNAG